MADFAEDLVYFPNGLVVDFLVGGGVLFGLVLDDRTESLGDWKRSMLISGYPVVGREH